MPSTKILALAGSTRSGSFNQQLIQIAAAAARQAGAEVELLDLKNFELPLFNQDLESDQGIPDNAMELKSLFKQHHGLLIASPEYNSSISPLLKNTIDWISRPVEGEPPLVEFRDKVAGLMAASPGALGGLRGLVHVRAILQNIGVTVVPQQMAIPKAGEAFDDQGQLKDDSQREKVEGIGRAVAEMCAKLNG